MIERITEDDITNQPGHVYRYRLAADLIMDGETVLDVASGIGYGSALIAESKQVNYVGVDKIEPSDTFLKHGSFLSDINLDVWSPTFDWDVSVSFETLEHVEDPQRLADTLMRAKRLVVVSTPTRPTKHLNAFHLHDFTVDDVIDMFSPLPLLHVEDQPEELSHIFVFDSSGR
jgi:2-polyprenyl-3-methyl-5-hydroxy-6-metoxy-1,4-benzoquinol methylase